MIEEARRLVKIGLPIIPLCPPKHEGMSDKHIQRCKCAGKMPIIKGWSTRDVTTEDDLHMWATQFRKFNIGLPLGQASGFCGVDIDGDSGETILMQMSNGDIPDTWEFNTGAGRRLLYSIPPGIKTKKFTEDGKKGEHDECALLCDGQQTVIPPSVHHTGRTYQWKTGHSPWDIDCTEAPRWLIALIKAEDSSATSTPGTFDLTNVDISNPFKDEFSTSEFSTEGPPGEVVNKKEKGKKGKSGHKVVVTDELLSQVIPEGQRDNTMTAIVGHYCANRDLRRLGKNFILDICMQHNKKYCDPPLEDAAIKDKVNFFYDAEMMKDSQFKEQKEKKATFQASRMAAIVRNRLLSDGLLLHFDQSSHMYYYCLPTKGPWICTRNTTLINKWIRRIITDPKVGDELWDKQGYIDETRKALEELFTEAFKQFDDFDLGAHADELSKYIVVDNGMVDWHSGEIVPWDPQYYTTVSFKVNYDPEATCPRFEQYMAEWLPNPDVRRAVQEYIGYCLVPNSRFRKALFLYGKGKNGKSMLLEFLQEFFGDNRSTMSYDSLFQRFGPANLKGKLVNLFDDTTVSFVKDTGIIKNLIAGGTIAAEFKGKDHFTFTNVARFIFSAQETPKTADHSEAWYDRWIFVKFPNKFKASNEKKIEMQTAMKEELAGIFNWMLIGLRRLIENDTFTPSEDLFLSAQEYRCMNDSVALFVNTLCDKYNDCTTVNELYRVYSTWSELEGLRPLSKRTFLERLQDLGYEKRKGYADGRSGHVVIQGLRLNKECEEYRDNMLEYSLALQS